MADDDVASTFAYDAAAELIRYCPAVQWFNGCDVDSSGDTRSWHYVYDDAGHLATQIPPDNQAITDLARRFWTYDAGGRLTNVCDDPDTTCGGTNGRHSVPTYDAVGRPTALTTYTTAGGTTISLKTATTYLGDGQVTKTQYYEGTTPTLLDTIDQTYDTLGRPDQIKRSTTVLTDYAWNADGTLASRLDDGIATATTFGYDWADRLVSANLPDDFSTAVPTFAWRADGLIKSRSFDTGAAVTFAYDRAKRPTEIAKGSDWLRQTYDRDGNVTSESRSLWASGDAATGTQTFTYDDLNRVEGSTGLTASRSYSYDLNGNRKSKTIGGTTTTYGYDRTDQLSSINASVFTATHTIYGDLTSKREDSDGSTTSFLYDLGGKLTKIDRSGTSGDANFTFDALSRLKNRTIGSTTDTYSYLGTSEVVTAIEYNAGLSGPEIMSVVDAMGNRLGVDGGATMNWLLPDLHGSVAASLSANEATFVNAVRYDAWGETITTGDEGGTAVGANYWKYQGRLDISNPAIEPLYDMSARFYSPNLGAFSQLDSVMGSAQNPRSMNRFLYAHANPATLIDPTGHKVLESDERDTPRERYLEQQQKWIAWDNAQREKAKEKAIKRAELEAKRNAAIANAAKRAEAGRQREAVAGFWNVVQGAADLVSMLPIPGVSTAAGLMSAGISLARGDVAGALGGAATSAPGAKLLAGLAAKGADILASVISGLKSGGQHIPLGFEDAASFNDAIADIRKATGVDDARIGVRGSAATGFAYDKKTGLHNGPPFGQHSDIDFFVVSDALYKQGLDKGFDAVAGSLKMSQTRRFDAMAAVENLLTDRLGHKSTIRIFSEEGFAAVQTGVEIFGP